MTTRVLSQQARDLYRAAYPIGPTLGSTTFAAWMAETSMSTREVAVKLGCTELSVRSWASGRRVPTIELARRIEALTGTPIAAWVEVTPSPMAASHVETSEPTTNGGR
jgi:transcriptional regulator with XRE-family HTH domain